MKKTGESPALDEDYRTILKTAEQAFGGQKQRLADAIGITPSRYSKVYGGKDYALSVTNCLKLAQAARRHPSEVLRAFRKGDVADLIESAYGIADSTESAEAREIGMRVLRLRGRWLTLARGAIEAFELSDAQERSFEGHAPEGAPVRPKTNPGPRKQGRQARRA